MDAGQELSTAERVANALDWKLIYPREQEGGAVFLQTSPGLVVGPWYTAACALGRLFCTDCPVHDRLN